MEQSVIKYCDIYPNQEKYEWHYLCDFFDNNDPVKHINYSVLLLFDGRDIMLFDHGKWTEKLHWSNIEQPKGYKRSNAFWFLDVESKQWIKSHFVNEFLYRESQMCRYQHILHVINCIGPQHHAIDLFEITSINIIT